METLKTAVIGVGGMGQHHARVYSELKNSELVGIADLNLERAREISGKYGGFPYKDFKEMLEKEKPDAVSVAVPTKFHANVGCEVLKHTNALVEKPIADTLENGQKIVDTARANNKILMVGQIERFNPAIEFFKEWADKKKIEYLSLNAIRINPPIFRPGLDTGVIIDLAIHDVDTIRFLTKKEVSEVFASGRKIIKDSPGEDHAHIWMKMDGVSASVIANRVSSRKVRKLGVVFHGGYAEVDYIAQRIKLYAQYGTTNKKLLWHPERTLELRQEEPLKKELSHFIDSVSNNKQPRVTGEDALESLKIVLKAEKIVRRGLK